MNLLRISIICSAAVFLFLVALLPGGAEFVDGNSPLPAANSPGGPSRELTSAEAVQWLAGRRLFDRDTHQQDGLGTPLLNGDSCRACHDAPAVGGAGGLDVNVFRFGFDNGGVGPFMDLPGGQVASKLTRADHGVREEHHLSADVFEQRQTPTVFGLGDIDDIPDAEILANEDPTDANGDGIFGVARMLDVDGFGTLEVGHFGWKAQIPHAADFARDALAGELGLTAPDNGRVFGLFTDGDSIADPELSTSELDDLVFYMTHLAKPQRGGSTSPIVALGESVFNSVGCATCHIPSLMGPSGPVPLFSNLLLHDVMQVGFRGMSEPGAGVGLYRTPPLWGIKDTAPYLHDGRAETITQAIEMHASEAETVTSNYLALSANEREALLFFLNDL